MLRYTKWIRKNGQKYLGQLLNNKGVELSGGESGYSVYNTNPADTQESTKNDDVAGLFETIVSKIILLIGTGLYALFALAVGQPMSVEDIIFNNYTNTRLSFFTKDVSKVGENSFIEKTHLREPLNRLYGFFRGLAILVYLSVLIYMGIRILLSSTGAKKAKYKELGLYWVEGVLILFIFPYIMRYTILFNNAFVSFIRENKDQLIRSDAFSIPKVEMPNVENSEASGSSGQQGIKNGISDIISALVDKFQGDTDYMGIIYKDAWKNGWLVLTIAWVAMFIQIIGFLVAYFRRLLIVMFLIAIFPLVMVSYALDRIRDKKAQAFESWLKEYVMNIFNQSFHAITYVFIIAILSTIIADGDVKQYWVVILVAISFLSKGDDLLRAIFQLKGSADTVKSIGQSITEAAVYTHAVGSISKFSGAAKHGIIGTGTKLAGNAYDWGWNVYGSKVNATSARLDKEEKERELDSITLKSDILPDVLEDSKSKDDYKNDFNNAVQLVLGKKDGNSLDIENALKKIIEYRKQTNNKDAQQAIKEVMDSLSDDEKRELESMLQLYMSVEDIKGTGRKQNVKVNNKIDLAVSCLQRDENGNLTKTSQVLANKLARSGVDLVNASRVLGVKFNRDPAEVKKKKERENPLAIKESKARGRSTAKAGNRGDTASGTLLEKSRNARKKLEEKDEIRKSRAVRRSEREEARREREEERKKGVGKSKLERERNKKRVLKNSRRKPHENVTTFTGETANIHRFIKPGQKLKAARGSTIITSKVRKRRLSGLEQFARYTDLSEEEEKNVIPSGTNFGGEKKKRISTSASKGPTGVSEEMAKMEIAKKVFFEQQRQKRLGNEPQKTSYLTAHRKLYNTPKEEYNKVRYPTNDTPKATPVTNSTPDIIRIASVEGGVEEIKKVISNLTIGKNDPTVSSMDTVNKKKIVNLVEYIDEIEEIDGLSDEAKKDMKKAAIYASRLSKAKDGQDSMMQIFDMIDKLEEISKKYETSTNSVEIRTLNEIIENLGIIQNGDYLKTIKDFEINLRNDMLENPDLYVGNMEIVGAWNKYEADSMLRDIKVRGYSPSVERLLEVALECAYVIRDSDTGKYTATELIRAINQLRLIDGLIDKLEEGEEKEKAKEDLNRIFSLLGSPLSDYEAHIRIMVLNDPDSVDNNQNIVNECKQYIMTNYENIPDILRGGLRYRREDLEGDHDLRYTAQTVGNDFISDADRNLQERQEALRKEISEAEKNMNKYNKETQKLTNRRRIAKGIWGGTKEMFEAALNSAAYIGSVGVGTMVSGVSANGKGSTISQGAQGFLNGMGAAGDIYEASKDNVKGVLEGVGQIGDDLKDLRDVSIDAMDDTILGSPLRDIEHIARNIEDIPSNLMNEEHEEVSRRNTARERRKLAAEKYYKQRQEEYDRAVEEAKEIDEREKQRINEWNELERVAEAWTDILSNNNISDKEAEKIRITIEKINEDIDTFSNYNPIDQMPKLKSEDYKYELLEFARKHGLIK